jgi:hypothetical protein
MPELPTCLPRTFVPPSHAKSAGEKPIGDISFFHLIRCALPLAGLVTLPSGKVGATDRGMNKNAYRGHRFPPVIIQLTVWMPTYAQPS